MPSPTSPLLILKAKKTLKKLKQTKPPHPRKFIKTYYDDVFSERLLIFSHFLILIIVGIKVTVYDVP